MAPSPAQQRSQRWGLSLITALFLIGMGPASALASDRHDHEQARQALQTGQILPLGTVLERLAREQPGQVLEVELEHDKGRWLYEVKLLQNGGRVIKFNVDAATGEVLTPRARTNTQP